jgi:hypothetical protein
VVVVGVRVGVMEAAAKEEVGTGARVEMGARVGMGAGVGAEAVPQCPCRSSTGSPRPLSLS